MESTRREDNFIYGRYVEDVVVGIVVQGPDLDHGRSAASAIGIQDAGNLMLDQQVVVGSGRIDREVVTEARVGAPGGYGMLRDGNPAEPVLVAASTLLAGKNTGIRPCVPGDVVVGP